MSAVAELKAGREMDALVAETVVGWQWAKCTPELAAAEPAKRKRYLVPADVLQTRPDMWETADDHLAIGGYANVPHYSTDISQSWEIVEALHSRGIYLQLDNWPSSHAEGFAWSALLQTAEQTVAERYANTAPLAICRAALLAVENAP